MTQTRHSGRAHDRTPALVRVLLWLSRVVERIQRLTLGAEAMTQAKQ